MQPILHELLCADLMRDDAKSLTKVQVDTTHCSPLIYQASQHILEGDQVG